MMVIMMMTDSDDDDDDDVLVNAFGVECLSCRKRRLDKCYSLNYLSAVFINNTVRVAESVLVHWHQVASTVSTHE